MVTILWQRSFAFVDYDDDRSAEDAIKYLNEKDMQGLKIAVEWSKQSPNYDPRSAMNRPFSKDRRRDEKCYNCSKFGHIARDCRSASTRRRRDSRSRSPAPRYRGRRSRSPRRRDSRSPPRRNRSRSRSNSRDRRRRSPPKYNRRDSRERRDYRSRSRDRSASPQRKWSDRDSKYFSLRPLTQFGYRLA